MKKKEEVLCDPVSQASVKELKGVGDYLEVFSNMSFQARALGTCAKILAEMVKEARCLKVLTVAGAPVPGGLQGVLCDMIELGFVDVIITTGSQIAHDLVEGMGYGHYKGHPHIDDRKLREFRIDRMYDSLLDEMKLNEVDILLEEFWEKIAGLRISTPEIFKGIAEHLLERKLLKSRSFVVSAKRHGVTIFSPTIHDSEVGISLTNFNRKHPQKRILVDLIFDNELYTEVFADARYEKRGVLILGGGVPRNWAQQVTPMIEFIKYGTQILKNEEREVGYDYGILVTTDSPQFGGLSGSTLEEAISWNKYAPEAEFSSVHCDMTIALPLMVGAVKEWLGL